MTSLPSKQNKKLRLVIDLDICVGCHACAVSCKEWNTSGHSAPLHDIDPYGDDPTGVCSIEFILLKLKVRYTEVKQFIFLKVAYIVVMLLVSRYAQLALHTKERKMV